MLYTKLEANSYKGLPVNWVNDKKHSPLIQEILNEILDFMNSSVKDGKRDNFRPVLLRFDIKCYKEIDSDIDSFIKKSIKFHKEKEKYFKIYFQKENSKNWSHSHFIVIVDGKNDYKSYKKFAITIQKIWNRVNSEIELYTREENHYYKIWKKSDFDDAFYAASYLAKHRGKENRVKFITHDDGMETSNFNREYRLLRLPEVLSLLGISKSTLYAGMKKGLYPQKLKLGQRTSVWRKSDIIDLIQNISK